MAQILFTAINAEGRESRGMVEADGVAQAREQLVARGLRNVRLHQEASFALDVNALAASSGGDPQRVAAMALRFIEKPGLATLMREVARGWAWPLGVLAVVAGYAHWHRATAWAALLTALALLPFAVAAWQHRRARDHDRLLRAQAIGDWPTVLTLAQSLRAMPEKTDEIAFDLDIRCAYARIRQGQTVEAALAAIEAERWAERMSMRRGAYESQVALLHAAANRPQGFIEAMRQSAVASNQEPGRVLDLALAEARLGDVSAAEQALAAVDTSLLPPFATGFVAWTRGLIAVRRQQPGAMALLDEAVHAFLALSAHHPALWTALAFSVSDQALLLRTQGQTDKARASLAPVWPILRAHARPELLTELADLRPADSATSASPA